jgi:uncharacterized protein
MDRVPQSLLDGVLRVFDPVQVILFGSHARGEAGPDSDIDLFIVVDDDIDPERMTTRSVGQARMDYRGAVDLIVARRSNFEKRKHVFGALAQTVSREGVIVYERP